MATERYRFNADPQVTITVGSKVYHGGDELNLDESVAIDSRLEKVAKSGRPDRPERAEDVTPVEPTYPASREAREKSNDK